MPRNALNAKRQRVSLLIAVRNITLLYGVTKHYIFITIQNPKYAI
jgi:hypothetical protein